ncbi:site-specific integrase [Streptomyces yunnanensis]|uniref:Site-specific integrase n=1 Tax=Streptomyces yunnanensis TaxID=156453 RepID=A0ABY8AKD3_9ACTN|nr:tyrosine-type recombinase/integrase [Streptomyces yunnanensis]WEB45433.1 site-specific integrase [Streptomyces yunnanensis]
MTLAVVRNLAAPRAMQSDVDAEDFEQEIVDQYALALAATGAVDSTVDFSCRAVVDFVRFCERRLWTLGVEEADRYLVFLRRERGLRPSTVQAYAGAIVRFYDFAISRYQGDIHALTGCVMTQPIDEFNRPARANLSRVRVPPSREEVEALFTQWAAALPSARKYLPAARDYMAASLWRRGGLRIRESAMLDIRDWRPDLGHWGKLHIRFAKGSRGRGPKTRLIPAIDGIDALMSWWLTDVRHQFADDWTNPDAPLLPSERRDELTGSCCRIGTDALRSGLAGAVQRWLPEWGGLLTPHGLRHYCASALYERGMDLKAIQDLLGHNWLSTTSHYIHVPNQHIENEWIQANDRTALRLQV